MQPHKESFVPLAQLGLIIPAYQPTFDFPGEFINEAHRYYSICPTIDESSILIELRTNGDAGPVIEGWLRREDAQKIYELAYFATGDILELGAYRGLSTSILARANADAPVQKHIYSVELDPAAVAITQSNITLAGLAHNVTVLGDDAVSAIRKFAAAGQQFAFVFVDHSHTYAAVYDVCRELPQVMLPGGFCLFHDFNDQRNSENNKDYGVYQAVLAGLNPADFEFYGVYGCAGLYRFKPAAATA